MVNITIPISSDSLTMAQEDGPQCELNSLTDGPKAYAETNNFIPHNRASMTNKV